MSLQVTLPAWRHFTRESDGARVATLSLPRKNRHGLEVGLHVEVEQSRVERVRVRVDGYCQHAGKRGCQLNVMGQRFSSWEDAFAFAERYSAAALRFLDAPEPEWPAPDATSYTEA